jgi:hypothetical protein
METTFMNPQSTPGTINAPRSTEQSLRTRESLHPTDDFLTYLREYARQKPDVAALWCFGIGFVLGWKLKPW